MQRTIDFSEAALPSGFRWLNPPARCQLGNGLEIVTDAETDFWQRTHYGFRRDNGHGLLTRLTGNFCLTTRVEFRPRAKYDQCGLMVRLDRENWIKLAMEYEDAERSRLGSVVTNLGFSDWATQDVSSQAREAWYRISNDASDFLLEHSADGERWQQLRILHLHQAFEALDVGVYACSPVGADFWCRFHFAALGENRWKRPVAG